MQIVIKSKNLELTDSLNDYVERKVSKLDRFLPNISEARVDLAVQTARSAQDRQTAQVTLWVDKGAFMRCEESSSDIRASVDMAIDKLTRQAKRYKGKHWQAYTRSQTREEAEEIPEEESDLQVVRTKQFETRPMDVEEAIEQMELLGHDFFVFYDTASDGFAVVYRRRDGGYGLLLPELS